MTAGRCHPHYAPIFKALAARENVVMLNNSAAGAASYANWLGLVPSKVQVIRNGVDFSKLTMPSQAAIEAYRYGLGIPSDATGFWERCSDLLTSNGRCSGWRRRRRSPSDARTFTF